MINISKAARERIQSVAQTHNQGHVLRITVDGGGCSGYQYIMNMTHEVTKDDTVVKQDGAALVALDKLSAPFLQDCELDFVENISGGFFKINNPHAKNSCGCGNSFELGAN